MRLRLDVASRVTEAGAVTDSFPDDRGAAYDVAIAYAPSSMRPALVAGFALDRRLAEIDARVSEPLLEQMRFAWWRERLAEPAEQRPQGDPVLDGISRQWAGEERALIDLVDGWEALLSDQADDLQAFGQGQRAFFAAFARLTGEEGDTDPHADAYAGALKTIQRLEAEIAPVSLPKLPRTLRPLAILGTLGNRVLKHGRGPLFGDRGAALTALRVGIFGR